MKFAVMGIVLCVAGFFAFQQFKPKPLPPPPPPPPPAITLEPQPIINVEEQAKIIKSASDQDPGVRWESLVLLGKMKSPQALPLMFEKLEKDPEAEVRIKIVAALGQRRGPEITQHLLIALRDQEPTVKVAALQALDTVGDYAAASAITDTLKDQDETVRMAALKTLNDLQDKKAAELAAEQKRQEDLRRQAEEAAKKR